MAAKATGSRQATKPREASPDLSMMGPPPRDAAEAAVLSARAAAAAAAVDPQPLPGAQSRLASALPVMRFAPRKETEEADRLPLFTIGDAEYTVPAHPSAVIALTYMEIMADEGMTAAAENKAHVYLLREMLGPEGFAALKGCDLTLADLGELVVVLNRHAMGALEAPKEQPANG